MFVYNKLKISPNLSLAFWQHLNKFHNKCYINSMKLEQNFQSLPAKGLRTECFIPLEILTSKTEIDANEYPSTANGNCVQQYNDRDFSSVSGNQ